MKTKIIYISGSEVFEMSQVRAAFEEIRQTLGLDKDTILFGVPVDCDDALADKNTVNTDNESINTPIQTIKTDEIANEPEPIISVIQEEIIENNIEPVVEDVVPVIENSINNVEEIKNKALSTFNLVSHKPIVLVVGGSLGALTINESIINSLDYFVKNDIQLIWQTGKWFFEKAKRRYLCDWKQCEIFVERCYYRISRKRF